MEKSIWSELSDKFERAFDNASKSLTTDFKRLKNVPDILNYLKDLNDEDLLLLLDQARKIKKRKNPKTPTINADFYYTRDLVEPEDRALILKVEKFCEQHIAPNANKYWHKGDFPFEIIKEMKQLGICGLTYEGYGLPAKSSLLEGLITEQISKVDVSTCTFFGAHSGLAMGSIYYCGSEAQKSEFLPRMHNLDLIGAFGLTEPNVGSAISMGMETTCKREGEHWIINGQKKWIGNATFADIIIIWAKDVEDNQVKGFIVDRQSEGLTTEKIRGKMSLRTVQNALITLKDCKVPHARKLENANTFKDTAKVLRMTRAGVAWQAVGCARGAYENTLKYTLERRQFGRPIAAFQLTQDLLAKMLSQLTAMQTMVSRLSQLQDEERLTDEQASLAKIFCTVGCREVVSMGRELMGGNGILLENNVARFLADAEALYSYEGTKQINSLIVGRSITGMSAFV